MTQENKPQHTELPRAQLFHDSSDRDIYAYVRHVTRQFEHLLDADSIEPHVKLIVEAYRKASDEVVNKFSDLGMFDETKITEGK